MTISLPSSPERILVGGVLGLLAAGIASWLVPDPDFPPSFAHDPHQSCIQQVQWTAWGLILGVVGAVIDYRHWRKWSFFLLVCSIALLAMAYLTRNYQWDFSRNQRMLQFRPIQFPPGELAKFAVVAFFGTLAAGTRSKKRKLDAPLLLVAMLLLIVICLCLMVGKLVDAFLITVIGSAFLFLSGKKPWGTLVAGYVVSTFVVACIFWDFHHPHHAALFLRKLLEDPLRATVQFGALALFIAVIISGLRISTRASGDLGKMLGLGITVLLALQGIFYLYWYVSFGFLLREGQPIPFLGGSGWQIGASLFQIGVLINISRVSALASAAKPNIMRREG